MKVLPHRILLSSNTPKNRIEIKIGKKKKLKIETIIIIILWRRQKSYEKKELYVRACEN